jgi:hypothetical protein
VPLAEATARAAACLATGGPAAGAVPARAAALASQVQRSRLMIKASLVAAAVLALGAAGVSSDDARAGGRPVSGRKFTFVDLQPRGNHRLADALGDLEGNSLAALPRGPQELAGTWFSVGARLIRVRGRRSPEPPEAVRGIAIDARFDVLHILHSTMFGNAFGADDGTEIGAYLVRYADGSDERIPIVYGADVRDWWRSGDVEVPTRARLAWCAPNAATGPDDAVRLFSSRWTNPHPEKKVLSIDFETKDTPCAPFLVAMTLERTLYRRGESAGR